MDKVKQKLLQFFSKKQAKNEFEIRIPSLYKRFFATLIDIIIIAIITSNIVVVATKKQMSDFYKSRQIKQIEMTTNKDTGILEPKTDDNQKTQLIIQQDNTNAEKTEEDLKQESQALINAVNQNPILRYTVHFISLIYFTVFLLLPQHATIGQRIFNLVIVRNDGLKLTFNDVVNRVCFFHLLGISAVSLLFTEKQITIYDFFSKTRVLEIK